MEAIEQNKVNNLSLATCLLCYQSEHDKALGLSYPGDKTKSLAWYYHIARAYAMSEAFKSGVMQRAKERMAAIITEAETAPIERQRQLLDEALKLKEFVDRVTNV